VVLGFLVEILEGPQDPHASSFVMWKVGSWMVALLEMEEK
jgi:hypothetical protein